MLELLAQGIDNFLHRAALAGRLEADEDVAGERLGGEQAKLGAGAADVAGHVGRLLQHRLDPPQHLVGLGERGAHGHPVIEHKGPFVHVGHEARSPGGGTATNPAATASSAKTTIVRGNRSPTRSNPS